MKQNSPLREPPYGWEWIPPFKSTNVWFVEPGRSNRLKQPGTTKPPTVDTNILIGIAMPLLPNTSNIRQWNEREEPPHLPNRESRGDPMNPPRSTSHASQRSMSRGNGS